MDIAARAVDLIVSPAVHGVVALLGFECDAAIKHGLVLSDVKPILRIFVVVRIEDEITILGMIAVVCVRREFRDTLCDSDPPDGNFMKMLVELFEKGSGIIILSVITGIPFVRPPAIGAIYRVRGVGTVHRYPLLSA